MLMSAMRDGDNKVRFLRRRLGRSGNLMQLIKLIDVFFASSHLILCILISAIILNVTTMMKISLTVFIRSLKAQIG